MITLKRLKAENFKALRSIDLTFPTQGSVLIEGQNEAGKSTLFEAVYVALYGKPLVGEENMARQEEIIQHGQARATVQLLFHIGPQAIAITRVFERRKSQQATLIIQHPDAQPEVINRVKAIEERLLKELGNLDGDNLRNSCFVEQKELGRIEALSRGQREQAIQKLLGLEKLTRLIEQFKFKREQERELHLAERHLKLARLQAEISTAASQEAALAERLDAVQVVYQVQLLTSLADQKREIEERLNIGAQQIQEARVRLQRCDALSSLIASCGQAQLLITDIGHTYKELAESEKDLAALEHIEQVELPATQQRQQEVQRAAAEISLIEQARKQVSDTQEALREALRLQEALKQAEIEQQEKEQSVSLARERVTHRQAEAIADRQRMEQQLQAFHTKKAHQEQALTLVRAWETANEAWQTLQQEITLAATQEQEFFHLQKVIQRQESDIHALETTVARSEQEMQAATDRSRQAAGYEALTAWIRLKGVEDILSTYSTRQQELVTMRQETEKNLAEAQTKTRFPFLSGIICTVSTLLFLVLGMVWTPALIVVLFTGIGAFIFWLAFSRARKAARPISDQLTRHTTDIQQVEIQRQAAIQASGDPAMLGQYEQQLQRANMSVPENLAAGRAIYDKLHQELGEMPGALALQATAQETRDTYTRLSEQLKHIKTTLEENMATCKQLGNPSEHLHTLQMQAAEQQEQVTLAEQGAKASLQEHIHDTAWPTSSSTMQTLLLKCQADIEATEETRKRQEHMTANLIQEAETDLEHAEKALQQAQEVTLARRETDPAGKLSRTQADLAEAMAICNQRTEALQPILTRLQLRTEADVEPERGRIAEQVSRLQQQCALRPSKQEKRAELQHAFAVSQATTTKHMETLLTNAHHLNVTDLPDLPLQPENSRISLSYRQTLTTVVNEIEHAIQASLTELDELGTRQTLERLLGEQGTLKQSKTRLAEDQQKSQHVIDTILSSRHLPVIPIYTNESIHQRWQLTAFVLPEEQNQVSEHLKNIQKQLYALHQQEQQLASELQHPGTPLSVDEYLQRVTELVEERQICEQATHLLRETHDRIARRVLPITERNMQPLLQQLTGGRYHDVRLTPDEDNEQQGDLDYRIRVWDSAAGRFVGKNLFSGGTRDQCSLALRLAFALATLPQELGIAPGFIFLDEPLSAFDAPRAQALVELLTSGTIAQQFSQVVLISHAHAFNREAFHYHVRIDNGQIIESNLPDLEERDSAFPQFQQVGNR